MHLIGIIWEKLNINLQTIHKCIRDHLKFFHEYSLMLTNFTFQLIFLILSRKTLIYSKKIGLISRTIIILPD